MTSPQIKQTVVEIAKPEKKISIDDSIFLLGSCFATEIGHYLADLGFNIYTNPFGVLYNPTSIANSLDRLSTKRLFTLEDVIRRDTNPVRQSAKSPAALPDSDIHRPIAPDGGGFVSFCHHGSFARKTPQEFLDCANSFLEEASAYLYRSKWIIITFGTAWTYRHIERNIIVSNCHKHPAWEYQREFLSIDEIVKTWSGLIENMPDRQFVFTVSPIRHKKDGMHGNQLSKAVLLLAAEQLAGRYSNVHYFPAYEIVLDELRDYSWFAEDGIHISKDAVEIVCRRFLSAFLSK